MTGAISRRDYFAGQALLAILTNDGLRRMTKAIAESPHANLVQDNAAMAAVVNEQIAGTSRDIADAMIAALDED